MQKYSFNVRTIVITSEAWKALERTRTSYEDLLRRFYSSDWGDSSSDDCRRNDMAAKNGDGLLAAYQLSNDTILWISTLPSLSVTTVLMPSEHRILGDAE